MRNLRTAIAVTATLAATTGAGLATLAPPAMAAVPACGNASLDYGRSGTDGAAGTQSFVLLYRNHTHAACTLRGYPGADAMSSAGRAFAHATRTTSGLAGGASHGVQTITVPAGGYASAVLEWSDVDRAGVQCRNSAGLDTIAPNTSKLFAIKLSVTNCSLQVHPVVLGWTGRA